MLPWVCIPDLWRQTYPATQSHLFTRLKEIRTLESLTASLDNREDQFRDTWMPAWTAYTFSSVHRSYVWFFIHLPLIVTHLNTLPRVSGSWVGVDEEENLSSLPVFLAPSVFSAFTHSLASPQPLTSSLTLPIPPLLFSLCLLILSIGRKDVSP